MSETTVTAEALNDLRQRYLDGKDWTREELKNAIFTMIGDRLASVQAVPKAKAAKAAPVSLDDLLVTPKQAAADLANQVPKATEPPATVTNKVHLGVDTGVKTATEQRMEPKPTETGRIDATKENVSNKPRNTGGFF